MIASVFASGTAFGHSVRQYLLQKERAVPPRLLRGNVDHIVDLIDSIHRKWKYTSGVLRFHKDDQPTKEQLDEIMDSFEKFMFAGKPRDTFDLIWVEHLDKGDQELHFVVPRIDLETHQDLNIAPPGYADQFKVWAEKINLTFGFKNPLKATSKSKSKQEGHAPKAKRAAVQQQMNALFADGTITSREDLIAQLNKIGTVRSSNPNTKFIAVAFDGLERRIRFSAGIFAKDFDFKTGRPGNSARHSPTMADYVTENGQSNKRPPHRFELPIADPFGDQALYAQDIEERYEAAFQYRKERFKMIRARSLKLKRQQAQQPPAPSQMPNQESEHDVERLRKARSRTRSRKSRLAELRRNATKTDRSARRAYAGIRKALQRAFVYCLKALTRKGLPTVLDAVSHLDPERINRLSKGTPYYPDPLLKLKQALGLLPPQEAKPNDEVASGKYARVKNNDPDPTEADDDFEPS